MTAKTTTANGVVGGLSTVVELLGYVGWEIHCIYKHLNNLCNVPTVVTVQLHPLGVALTSRCVNSKSPASIRSTQNNRLQTCAVCERLAAVAKNNTLA